MDVTAGTVMRGLTICWRQHILCQWTFNLTHSTWQSPFPDITYGFGINSPIGEQALALLWHFSSKVVPLVALLLVLNVGCWSWWKDPQRDSFDVTLQKKPKKKSPRSFPNFATASSGLNGSQYLKWPWKQLISCSQILIEKEAYCVTASARPLVFSGVCMYVGRHRDKLKNVDLTDTTIWNL